MTATEDQSMRTWRGNDGKFEVEASYVGLFQKTKVKLRKAGGGMIAIPIERLSEADAAYVQARSGQTPLSTTTTTSTHHDIAQLQPSMAALTLDNNNDYSPAPAPPPEQQGQTPLTIHTTESLSTTTTATQVALPTPVERHGLAQQVIPMRPEAVRLLSQRSLSSITERLGHGQWQQRPQSLSDLPERALYTIAQYLDARTRVRLASTCTTLFQAVFRPQVWRHIWFMGYAGEYVDSATIHAMTLSLQRHQLQHAVQTITLDGTSVNADAIVHVLIHFPALRWLSVKGCWGVHSFPLGGKLMHLVASRSGVVTQLERFELGKALRRGVTQQDLEDKPNAPQSFGQDLAVIRNALEQLARRPVQMDCFLCDYCHVGAAAAFVHCVSCGPVYIHKCNKCAPRCDRCSIRTCNRPGCRASQSVHISTTTCGRCDRPLSICNHNQACAHASKNPCGHCNGLFHAQCRTSDGGYASNQCSRCGIVACPTCELVTCAGGCLGQWCRNCASDKQAADLIHCKCIVINKTGGKIRKRTVCHHCRKACSKCHTTGFCQRCLGVHSKQCR
ncbi:hypothetical protein LRAMOSA11399 [Lichtheimia ramosa]|uniref:F-box domain-containing protein n=1 Tax=Lichtheimia ramosa TaxID=688394 RepID=A0A077WV56_9FUNG|nr:hypothetical protein LRAMOSA11399 [Lichtheimia ramosa]